MNLEKKLLKENQKLATPKELLQIREMDRLDIPVEKKELSIPEQLHDLGFDTVITMGQTKTAYDHKRYVIEKYGKDRVFTEGQIKNVCNKYYLRFLKAKRFRGSLDAGIPGAVKDFQTKYNKEVDRHNLYIMAPASSFQLEERPKDPLLFLDLGEGMYYLLYKWGNDLSATRRITGFFFSPVTPGIGITALILFVWSKIIHAYQIEALIKHQNDDYFGGPEAILTMIITLVGGGILSGIIFQFEKSPWYVGRWNSKFNND